MSAVARRRRVVVAGLAAGVVAAVLALVLTGGGAGGSAPIAERAASVVPADALVWVHLSTDGDRDAVRHASDVAKRFPSFGRLRADLLTRLSVGGGDVGRWLGDEAGLALLDSPTGTAASLVVLGVRDEGGARRFIGAGTPSETYRGVKIQRYGAVSAALAGGFLLLGAPDVLHRSIDLAQGRGEALAGVGAFRRALTGLPSERVADAYVTSGGVRRLLDPAGGVLGAAGALLDRPGLQAVGLALTATDPGLVLRVHSLSVGGGPAAFPPFEPKLVREVPAGVLAYLGVRGFDRAIGRLLGTASGALGQVAARIRPLLAPLRGEVAIFATARAPAPILTVLAAAPDQAALRASLARLRGRRTKVAGIDVTVLRAGSIEIDAAAFDGKLVLSTAPEGIEAVRKRKGSLDIRSVVGSPRGRLSSLVFLDFDQLLGLGEQTGLNDSRAYRAVREDLRQVRALGARSSGSGGDTTADIRIRLR